MKKNSISTFYFFLINMIALSLCPDYANAQWTQQTSGTTNQLLRVQALNDNLIWISGNGRILKTTNGGDAWSSSYSGSDIFYGLSFANKNTGWAYGRDDTGLGGGRFTTDGGSTWLGRGTADPEYLIYDIFGLEFSYKNSCVVGENGVIARNWGGQYHRQSLGDGKDLYSCYFTDANYGWAVGDGGIILKHNNVPLIDIVPTSLDFDSTTVGSIDSLFIWVRNYGVADLTIDSIQAPVDFSVSPMSSFGILPLDSMMFTIYFSPTIENTYVDSIYFFCNDPVNSIKSIEIQGVSVPFIDTIPPLHHLKTFLQFKAMVKSP